MSVFQFQSLIHQGEKSTATTAYVPLWATLWVSIPYSSGGKINIANYDDGVTSAYAVVSIPYSSGGKINLTAASKVRYFLMPSFNPLFIRGKNQRCLLDYSSCLAQCVSIPYSSGGKINGSSWSVLVRLRM